MQFVACTKHSVLSVEGLYSRYCWLYEATEHTNMQCVQSVYLLVCTGWYI